jgi:hypothetical protein
MLALVLVPHVSASSSLRIYGTLDDVMRLLADELQVSASILPMDAAYAPCIPPACQIEPDVFRIPFDACGQPSKNGETTVWDLRIGRYVKLTGGPYAGDLGQIIAKNEEGHYCLLFENSVNTTFHVRRRAFQLWLGAWWVDMACQGCGITGAGSMVPVVPATAADFAAQAAAQPELGQDMTKYHTMVKIGLPPAAIRQKMECDGVRPADQDVFFA